LSEKKCWVCLRITPEITLKQAHRAWKEQRDAARKIGLEASEIIEKAYHENPFFFCHKLGKTVLSGLFYLLAFRHNAPTTQRKLAEALGVTDVTVRNSYAVWLKTFPAIFHDFQEGPEISGISRFLFKGTSLTYIAKKWEFMERRLHTSKGDS